MLLYNSMVSGNCYKVRLLFAHLGVEYERRELDVFDRSDRADVLGELNPAVLFHFAAGTDYLPDDRFQRAQVLQWMFFEQYEVEPNLAVARFWALAGIHAAPDEMKVKRAGGERALDALERHLGNRRFLVADRYTIADIALFGYTHVAPEGGFELEPYPSVRAWLTRVAAQPGHIGIAD
jgi:glutathione S-transferase